MIKKLHLGETKKKSCFAVVLGQAVGIIILMQSNLYKTTTLGTTQKRSSWAGDCLIKHLYKMTTNQM